jgi:hypothetical protein
MEAGLVHARSVVKRTWIASGKSNELNGPKLEYAAN